MGVKTVEAARRLPEWVGESPNQNGVEVQHDDIVVFTDHDSRVKRVIMTDYGYQKVHDPALEAICDTW